VPVETSYDRTAQAEQPAAVETESARRDFDQGAIAAPAAPAPEVNVNLQQPTPPAPEVNVNLQQPAAPTPEVNVQQPAAPEASAAPAAPAVQGPDVNIPPAAPEAAPAVPPAPPAAPAAPEANAAPVAPAAPVAAPAATEALASDIQPLSFFLGKWNTEEHLVKDYGWGTDLTGTVHMESGSDGHALIGKMSMHSDKGNYDAHFVIAANKDTAMKVSKDLGFAKDSDFASEKSEEKAIPTSADKDVNASDVSNKNQFYVFFTDSKGHSLLAKQAWLDGNQFNEVFEFTKDGKTMTKHKMITKESDDKLSMITDVDDGTGMGRFSAGTATRAK
jgi:hypothetical protein